MHHIIITTSPNYVNNNSNKNEERENNNTKQSVTYKRLQYLFKKASQQPGVIHFIIYNIVTQGYRGV
jgi:uncharacterized protein YccT (UPF0319 family)